MNAIALSDRDVRQRSLVPPERLAACRALVIGVGAIGRQVALQLAALGVPELTLLDDDRVSVENLAPQGYWPEDLGMAKVSSTAAACRRCNPLAQVNPHAERFRRSDTGKLCPDPRLAVFVCVDQIATRRRIWESLRDRVGLFVDGRMSAEVIRVLTVADPQSTEHYGTTLFAAEEAFVGACTARSTIYTASIAAGLMVAQLARWLRQIPVDRDLLLNLLAGELTMPESALQ
jgi:sulfur carrier protein ThiS adenylyltransferase